MPASVTTFPMSVLPYTLIGYGPDGVRATEIVNHGSTVQRFGYDLASGAQVAGYTGTALTQQFVCAAGRRTHRKPSIPSPLRAYSSPPISSLQVVL